MTEEEVIELMGEPSFPPNQRFGQKRFSYEINSYRLKIDWPFIYSHFEKQFNISLENNKAVFKRIITDGEDIYFDLKENTTWKEKN